VTHHHESTINPENFQKYRRSVNINLIKERNHLLLTWKNLSPSRLFWHLWYLGKRIFAHPGYFKVFLAALGRKLIFAFQK
jgi:hypothetical protein